MAVFTSGRFCFECHQLKTDLPSDSLHRLLLLLRALTPFVNFWSLKTSHHNTYFPLCFRIGPFGLVWFLTASSILLTFKTAVLTSINKSRSLRILILSLCMFVRRRKKFKQSEHIISHCLVQGLQIKILSEYLPAFLTCTMQP